MRNFRENEESVLTALIPKKPVALSIGRINIDQRVVENAIVEDNNKSSTYKIHHNINEVSFSEQVKSNDMILIKKGVIKVQKSALVSKRQVMLYRLRLIILIKNE